MKKNTIFTSKQLLFKELFVGTLIYAVVLGFFDDYTRFVSAKSFSTIFLASFVLQCLTFLAFLLKKRIVSWFKDRSGKLNRILTVFFVWLVLFSSKFVFIWAVDFLFGDSITITGFFGILYIMLSVTIIHRLADKAFDSLK